MAMCGSCPQYFRDDEVVNSVSPLCPQRRGDDECLAGSTPIDELRQSNKKMLS
jgi:hypothetical protein